MYKIVLYGSLFLGLSVGSRLLAADPDAAWKELVMQALYAAGESHFGKAESMFIKAVHDAERFGPEDARLGTTLNSLGLVYRAEKKFPEAESAYRRALPILEKTSGIDSIDTGNVEFNLGTVLVDQRRHAAALPYLEKALETYVTRLGGLNVKTASVLCVMGESYRFTKNYPDAIKSYKRCADIRETDGGMDNPELADALRGIAQTYAAQGKFSPAESNFKLAEKIVENISGISSVQLAGMMEDHIALLRQIGGREKDIARLRKMTESIRRLQNQKRPV